MGFGFALKKIVGFASKKINYANRLGVAEVPALKLIGTSKNGIKVFRGTAKNGTEYTASFKKDGSPLKLITKSTSTSGDTTLRETTKQTLVKNYEKNEGLYLRQSNAEVRTSISWLGRAFKANDKVKIIQKSKYNDKNFGYDNMVDTLTTYTQVGNPNWKWTVHKRPGITKSVTYNKYNDNWHQTETYFELNNFQFPNGGAIHNGTIARQRGISPLDGGKFDRRTRGYAYAAPVQIKYNDK